MKFGARGITTTVGATAVIVIVTLGGAAYYFYMISTSNHSPPDINTPSTRTNSTSSASVNTSTTAPGQTPCSVAQLIRPVPGSTLPAGAVTFEWCNANADYFLTVESLPGAHDIFYAFAGGVGPGAGVVSITLGPACGPSSPTGCIPAKGETIYLTLWTLKKGSVVPPSPFSYSFTAASVKT